MDVSEASGTTVETSPDTSEASGATVEIQPHTSDASGTAVEISTVTSQTSGITVDTSTGISEIYFYQSKYSIHNLISNFNNQFYNNQVNFFPSDE